MTATAQITFLPSSDLEAAHRFYHDALDLDLVLDQGSCRIYRITETGFLGVCERSSFDVDDTVIFTIVTEDVDGWCDSVRARGVAIESGPGTNPRYGIYHAFLRDPDGNRLEVQRFDDPTWAAAP